MNHVIIGTSGHIDHGKTTLIKALTGKSTDRLEEEKERGISIELGFTYFDLPNGQRAGIIDVPGHERFIRNMMSGIVGIDIVILVVAADEGFMPQTREHLDILDLLGREKGIIALTKCDLVEEEWLELVEDEIKDEVRETFLEEAPIVRISSTENKGIDELIGLLDKYSLEIEKKNINDTPRLPIDRSFIIPGFGTIVAGTLLSGSLKIDDELRLYPTETVGRIRTIQVHGEDEEIAYAGQRVAINLAGIEKEDAQTGYVAAPEDSMEPTMMIDAKVKLLKSMDRPIENRTRIRVYIGTKEVLARIVILDKEKLYPGEEAYVQLRLEEKIVTKMKDRFIIRFYSPMYTIGGGEVLDANPSKKSRFDEKVVEELRLKDKGSPKDLVENLIKGSKGKLLSKEDLLASISILENELESSIDKLVEEEKIMSLPVTNEDYYVHKETFSNIGNEIKKELEDYHKRYPLREGMLKEEVRSKYLSEISSRVGEAFINKLEENGYIKQERQYVSLKSHKIEYSEKDKKVIDNIIKSLNNDGFLLKRKEEVKSELKLEDNIFNEIFNALINDEKIIRLNEELYITKERYEEAKGKLEEYIRNKGEISVGEFRDLLETNRKVSIALLEYFDQQRITKRQENIRTLYKS